MIKEEGNNLIACFMGFEFDSDYLCFTGDPAWLVQNRKWDNQEAINKNKQFIYDMSWDCLIPVIEKIEKAGYLVRISGTSCSIENVFEFTASSKIEAVWLSCVKFIIIFKNNGFYYKKQ
jgi:hypothetical protein